MKTRLDEFKVLQGNDVMTAQISDHHPMIHDGVLFWNIMMQGRIRQSRDGIIGYNNGFGIVENDKQYKARLTKVGRVIAEIVYHNKEIQAVTLCEGPIEPDHVDTLMASLKKFEFMKPFTEQKHFHASNKKGYPNWGLLMLADSRYEVSQVQLDSDIPETIYAKLTNRFQLWKLNHDHQEKYIALAHFPFSGDEYVINKKELSTTGEQYCHLINNVLKEFADKYFIFCADFNFNPYLIGQWKDRVVDHVSPHNSILLTQQKETQTVTVDGILLSNKEKQKYTCIQQLPLFGIFKRENKLFEATVRLSLGDVDQIQHRNIVGRLHQSS